MLNQLKLKLRQWLINRRIWISRATELSKIEGFLKSTKAIETNYELIRIGGDGDGGYLVPNDFENIDTCFSPGVSDIANFENDLTKIGIKCFMADYSVEKPPIENKLFDFEKKFLGAINDHQYMTLENWVKEKAPDKKDLILQMDIEHSEYSVIYETPIEILKKFKIMVIEFHGLDSIFNPFGFDLIDLTFKKLLKHHEIVHIHPNNCFAPIKFKNILIPPTMEITFLRKDRITMANKISTFPHKLDRPCVPNNPNYTLPECWR